MKKLEGQIEGAFFVSNCDIFIEEDYAKILEYHQEKRNDLTLVTSVKNYHIPYGICEIENGGTLTEIKEKPEYNFLVNTGMYILDASVLSLIPDDTFYHITELAHAIKVDGGRVGVFPVGEDAWIDVGQWSEYKKARDTLSNLGL